MPLSNYSALDTQPLATLPICRATEVLLKAAIAAGSIDSYIEKFMWKDSIDIKKVSCDQITKLAGRV